MWNLAPFRKALGGVGILFILLFFFEHTFENVEPCALSKSHWVPSEENMI
jgi:hypothetical protein